jgi:hypothetical protein
MSPLTASPEYKSAWWSIYLVPNWLVDEDAACVSFTKDDGVGALQISAYKHDSGVAPLDELHGFIAGECPEGVPTQPVACGAFQGLGVDYVAEGRFWLKRWLLPGLATFVTYNCNAKRTEADDITDA